MFYAMGYSILLQKSLFSWFYLYVISIFSPCTPFLHILDVLTRRTAKATDLLLYNLSVSVVVSALVSVSWLSDSLTSLNKVCTC